MGKGPENRECIPSLAATPASSLMSQLVLQFIPSDAKRTSWKGLKENDDSRFFTNDGFKSLC